MSTTERISIPVGKPDRPLDNKIIEQVNIHVETLLKQRNESYETFENEDIKSDLVNNVYDLQTKMDNFVRKTGDTVTGSLRILKAPEAKLDVANKEYVDWLYLTLSQDINEKLETKLTKNSDVDLNHFKIKNVQTPKDLNDVVTKNYVDQKLDSLNLSKPTQHIFSKGQIALTHKKTFFFNPGFVCPQKIHIIAVGFSTSPYILKLNEKIKMGETNPTKLYFMINNEIRSEYPIEKDVQLGYVLKEFDEPIVVEKGDNVMMVTDTRFEDASVNVSFY